MSNKKQFFLGLINPKFPLKSGLSRSSNIPFSGVNSGIKFIDGLLLTEEDIGLILNYLDVSHAEPEVKDLLNKIRYQMVEVSIIDEEDQGEIIRELVNIDLRNERQPSEILKQMRLKYGDQEVDYFTEHVQSSKSFGRSSQDFEEFIEKIIDKISAEI